MSRRHGAIIDPSPPPPKPQGSFSVLGQRPTGRFRIRISFFFFPVVEELWEHHSGEFRWRRLSWMHSVEFVERQQ